MDESTSTFAPRWLCVISACLWIFPFTFLSYFFNGTDFSFFLLLGYLFTFLNSFLKLSISSDDFENFPGWCSAQAIAAVPAFISIHLLFGDISFHFAPSIFIFLIVCFTWYFFLGKLPLVILYPISKFCVKVTSKLYFSKNIILKLLSLFLTISICFSFLFLIFSNNTFQSPTNIVPNSTTSGYSSDEPRQGEEVSKESEIVWIPTHGGTKYHRRSTCSGMEDPEKTTKDDAIRRGFDACQRCY